MKPLRDTLATIERDSSLPLLLGVAGMQLLLLLAAFILGRWSVGWF